MNLLTAFLIPVGRFKKNQKIGGAKMEKVNDVMQDVIKKKGATRKKTVIKSKKQNQNVQTPEEKILNSQITRDFLMKILDAKDLTELSRIGKELTTYKDPYGYKTSILATYKSKKQELIRQTLQKDNLFSNIFYTLNIIEEYKEKGKDIPWTVVAKVLAKIIYTARSSFNSTEYNILMSRYKEIIGGSTENEEEKTKSQSKETEEKSQNIASDEIEEELQEEEEIKEENEENEIENHEIENNKIENNETENKKINTLDDEELFDEELEKVF